MTKRIEEYDYELNFAKRIILLMRNDREGEALDETTQLVREGRILTSCTRDE